MGKAGYAISSSLVRPAKAGFAKLFSFIKKFMKRLLFLAVFAFALSAGCSKKEKEPEVRTVEYFTLHLTAAMNYSDITQTFGQPDADKGSGIHIYVYNLKDGTFVWIGYTDKILYARHMDSNNQLIATLL